jgi:hypothetical protein
VSYYLLDNPPARSQGRNPRRSPISGVIVLHTDEAPPQPGGSRATAGFISRRSDPGSYHTIIDSTTTTRLLPISWETWGAAAPAGTNYHAVHLAFRHQAHRWGADTAYDFAAVERMCDEIAHVMRLIHGDDAHRFVRWGARDDVLDRRPCITEHGLIQPGDRSDPWTRRPEVGVWRERILDGVGQRLAVSPPPTQEDDIVATIDELRTELRAVLAEHEERQAESAEGLLLRAVTSSPASAQWVQVTDGGEWLVTLDGAQVVRARIPGPTRRRMLQAARILSANPVRLPDDLVPDFQTIPERPIEWVS